MLNVLFLKFCILNRISANFFSSSFESLQLDIGHAGQTHSTHPTQPKECNAVKRLLSRWGLASCPELNKPPKEKPSHALTASGEPDGNPHTPRLEQGPTHEGKNPKKGRKGPFRARITQVWPDSGNSDVPTVPAVPAVPVEVLYPPVCKNSQQERLYFPTTNAPELQCSAKKCPSTCIYNGQIWTPDNDNPPPDYEFDLRFGKLLKKRKGFESSLVIPFELMDTCPEGRDCIKHYNLYIVEPTTHEGIIIFISFLIIHIIKLF